MTTAIDRLEALLADGRLHQAADLAAAGIPRVALQRAAGMGRATLYTRGVYCANELVGTPGLGIAAMALRYPEAVACMFTAAQWHDLSDEDPPELWLAIPRSRTRKAIQGPPAVRTVWWDGADMTAGVETVAVAGVPVRVTDPARTVVDLVRHRGKTGDEPAMKALHDYVRSGGSMGLLWERAKQVGAGAHLEPFVKAAEEFSESIPVRGP